MGESPPSHSVGWLMGATPPDHGAGAPNGLYGTSPGSSFGRGGRHMMQHHAAHHHASSQQQQHHVGSGGSGAAGTSAGNGLPPPPPLGSSAGAGAVRPLGSSPRVGSVLGSSLPIPKFQHPSHALLEENGFKQVRGRGQVEMGAFVVGLGGRTRCSRRTASSRCVRGRWGDLHLSGRLCGAAAQLPGASGECGARFDLSTPASLAACLPATSCPSAPAEQPIRLPPCVDRSCSHVQVKYTKYYKRCIDDRAKQGIGMSDEMNTLFRCAEGGLLLRRGHAQAV